MRFVPIATKQEVIPSLPLLVRYSTNPILSSLGHLYFPHLIGSIQVDVQLAPKYKKNGRWHATEPFSGASKGCSFCFFLDSKFPSTLRVVGAGFPSSHRLCEGIRFVSSKKSK